jgi:hypothetical protein
MIEASVGARYRPPGFGNGHPQEFRLSSSNQPPRWRSSPTIATAYLIDRNLIRRDALPRPLQLHLSDRDLRSRHRVLVWNVLMNWHQRSSTFRFKNRLIRSVKGIRERDAQRLER